MDHAAQVALAFRAVLRREPDAGGLATYAGALQDGHDLGWLIGVLASSDEFRAIGARLAGQSFPLDSAPPMDVRPDCTAAGLQALWDDVARVWSALGRDVPYWSVLTEERFRDGAADPATLASFHETGEEEVRRLTAWLARAGWVLPPDAVCAELGCGVGRITRALARRFGRVIGLDVSAPHLAMARDQMAREGLANTSFVQLRGPADLAALDGIDLFYSVISLQHSPPPIILDVLGRAFAGLRPGGCAFFQVPTYGLGYRHGPEYRARGEMEMHAVPQRAVLALAHRAGLAVAEVQADWCVGRPGEWISSTFLLLRERQDRAGALPRTPPGAEPPDLVT